MPIYEYKCTSCNKQFDLLQKMTASPIAQCPACLTETAHRFVSAPSFQLKGTGWYVTDFKNKQTNPNASPEAKTASLTNNNSNPDAHSTGNKTPQDSAQNTKNGSKTNESKTNDSQPKASQTPAKAVTEG